jgi:hypothetical protein
MRAPAAVGIHEGTHGAEQITAMNDERDPVLSFFGQPTELWRPHREQGLVFYSPDTT